MILEKSDTQFAESALAAARDLARSKALGSGLSVPFMLADAGTTGTPPSDDLSNMLNSVGKAPGATSIATVPSSPQSYELDMLTNVQTIESYIAVLTALVMYNKHPDPYDLSDPAQATQFVIDTANAKNFVMTGGTVKDIPLYLPGMSTASDAKTIHTTSASIHVDLLKVLFSGLSLAAGALTELDGVLTEVVDTLQDLQLKFQSETETFNHQISYYYFSPVDGSDPPLNEMKVRFLYLQVEQSSWIASIGKSNVQQFDFNMTLTTSDAVLNNNMVASNAAAIAQSCQQLTSKTPQEIQKLIGSKGIKIP